MSKAERLADQKTKWSSSDCMDAAAELRRLSAENETLREERAAWRVSAESAEKDAARYRWLRDSTLVDGAINESMFVSVDHPAWPDKWALVGEDLDAAVDAAMKEES